MDFGDIFSDYWWLLFPLAFFIAGGFSSFMRYQRTRAKIELLKTYAASGKEPPAELLRNLDREDEYNWNADGDGDSRDSSTGTPFLVILFLGLAGVFAYEGRFGLIGMGEVAYFVAMIMVVLAVAFLAGAVFKARL